MNRTHAIKKKTLFFIVVLAIWKKKWLQRPALSDLAIPNLKMLLESYPEQKIKSLIKITVQVESFRKKSYLKERKTLCVNACFFTFYFDPEHPAIIEGTEVKANCEVQRKQA